MARGRTWVPGVALTLIALIAVTAYFVARRDRDTTTPTPELTGVEKLPPLPFAPDPHAGPVEDPIDPSLRQETMETLERIDGQLYAKGETTPFDGYIVELYVDGTFRTRSRIVNGLMDGYSQGWYIDGGLQMKENFRNGFSHGIRERWHTNGVLAARAEIVEGRLHGAFHRWDEEGSLLETITMVDGEMHGPSEAYYPSGYLKSRVVMNRGQPVKSEQFRDGEVYAKR